MPLGLLHLWAVGLPYYLPAVMTWVLKNFRDTNELLVDWTIYQINPNTDDKDVAERYDSRFQPFTSTQWYACRNFLKYLLYEDTEGNIINAVVAKKALAGVEAKILYSADPPCRQSVL
jgi:hypothetical protein